MSNRALDRGAQLVYLGIEFLLPIEQLPRSPAGVPVTCGDGMQLFA